LPVLTPEDSPEDSTAALTMAGPTAVEMTAAEMSDTLPQ